MYTPLYFAQNMDIDHVPYKNSILTALQTATKDGDDALSFLWYDDDFLNPEYHGRFSYINEIFQNRKNWARMQQIFFGALEDKEPAFDQPAVRHTLAEIFSSHIVVNWWAKNKQVYTFDAEIELSLADTEEIKLPVRILDRLPYRTFYIEFAKDGIFASNFHGAFIHIAPEACGYLVYIMRVKEDGRAMFGKTALVPEESDGVFLFSKSNIASNDGISRNADWQEFGLFLMNALLYLCANNAQIQEAQTTKATYRPTKTVKNKFSEVRKWECGYRYGAAVTQKKKQKGEDSSADSASSVNRQKAGSTGRARVAHVRKAHWHHFWTGKRDGERALILHWIPPTFVHGQESDAAVIHKVQKGKHKKGDSL